uniref:Uncharacterized protein n=1 Tax=Oryza rufipogon TaxID=4529 RepID=A0A0E0NAB8_ORYRU
MMSGRSLVQQNMDPQLQMGLMLQYDSWKQALFRREYEKLACLIVHHADQEQGMQENAAYVLPDQYPTLIVSLYNLHPIIRQYTHQLRNNS